MLRPSYTDLLKVINEATDDETLGSRYTIVIAAAKRARQLVDKANPLINGISVDKPVSVAVGEIYKGKIQIQTGKDSEHNEIKGPLEEMIF